MFNAGPVSTSSTSSAAYMARAAGCAAAGATSVMEGGVAATGTASGVGGGGAPAGAAWEFVGVHRTAAEISSSTI